MHKYQINDIVQDLSGYSLEMHANGHQLLQNLLHSWPKISLKSLNSEINETGMVKPCM